MAVLERGHAPLPKEKGRAVLSVLDPSVESLLAGLGVQAELLHELRQFCKYWCRERNRFDIARRRGGLFGARLDKAGAERALKHELAKLGAVSA